MSRWSMERTAKVAIGMQLLILVRLPVECLRLHHVHGSALTWAMVVPFIHGELITALLAALAVLLHFAGKPVLVVWAAALNVAVLVAYKVAWM